jgi:hypothetical protein
MTRRAMTVLLAALGAACSVAAGFTGMPNAGQIAAWVVTLVCAAALQTITGSTVQSQNKSKKSQACDVVLVKAVCAASQKKRFAALL